MNIERPKSKQPIPENAKVVYKGVVFDVYQWEQKMYDNTVQTFEKVKQRDTVVVFPVLDNGDILLTEQTQPGRDFFIDASSGRVDEGEDILDAAKRELLEETGYIADEFILWKAQQPFAKTEYVIYNFIAKGCKKVDDQHVDAGEQVKLVPYSFDEFLKLGQNNSFRAYDIVIELLRAQLDENKYKELKELFKPE